MRAVRCAREIRDRMRELGVTTTAALHTGECELQHDAISGVPVSIAEQLLGRATTIHEIIVSGTVNDLVIGSGIEFEARGDHELHGIPGRWPTFAVTGDARECALGSAAELAPLAPRLDDRLVRTIATRAPSVARAAIRATRPHRPPHDS